MNVRMYVCNVCIYACTYIYVCIHVCQSIPSNNNAIRIYRENGDMYVCNACKECMYMYVCNYTACLYACLHIYVLVCMCVCVYVCMYVCNMYSCMFVCMHERSCMQTFYVCINEYSFMGSCVLACDCAYMHLLAQVPLLPKFQ